MVTSDDGMVGLAKKPRTANGRTVGTTGDLFHRRRRVSRFGKDLGSRFKEGSLFVVLVANSPPRACCHHEYLSERSSNEGRLARVLSWTWVVVECALLPRTRRITFAAKARFGVCEKF
ncbi:hypothetical protein MBOU_36550 [Mycobacterium bourgelatii]|uniref:Uncharacterized protein n=1 Tax=Mycobacterium bourgelatii TaxID=1273442 RepID=A0A7I9YSU8_MYCBU|nr:hypothetical protein MBOU_36550 [Mycobacterium bourgelatii]